MDRQKGAPDPIAVVGMSCRFSGIASDEHRFWHLLSTGMTTWSNNAKERFRLQSFWHPEAGLRIGMHLLNEDPAYFDNGFFNIGGVEAKSMDPQQRILLEVVYEALENAGVPLETLEGSNTGVYCASNHAEYDKILARDPEVSPTYRFTGTGATILANRISYLFDLRGPSLVIDTACSSSLVALHNACNALWSGEIDQAILGSCNLILDPDTFSFMSSMTFLSPHGRCYAFDERANGYGRGEGCAALLLKPPRAAIRDGDAIRGVIRGTAVTSDGKTFGITKPSGDAQYETIRRAYEFAGLDPRETVFVEAHGTGTTVGDGAEITAFSKAFCSGRDPSKKLYVGSVKSNIGHTEHTAGLASVIKALLVLEKELMVPNPTYKTANTALNLHEHGIEVLNKTVKWPIGEAKRISINSTAFGGTNAHVIVESGSGWTGLTNGELVNGAVLTASAKEIISLPEHNSEPRLFCFTHRREQDIHKLAALWRKFLATSPSISLGALAYTLGSRRSIHSHRIAITANSLKDISENLLKVEEGSQRPIKAYKNPLVCFAFTGQGAQWAEMGRELMSFYPVFKQSIKQAEDFLLEFGATWSLTEELAKPDDVSRINKAELAQPCTTAIQIALVDLLDSFGIRPAQVCGHSSGEIAAAYTFGALSARDAIKIAYHRGIAVQNLHQIAPTLQGAMLAVGMSESAISPYLAAYQLTVNLACINSSNSVTLSGDTSSIVELAQKFDKAGIFNRKLVVEAAYHSHHMQAIEKFYYDNIKDVQPHASKENICMVSSVTGNLVQAQDLRADYWIQNLLSTVKFSSALSKMLEVAGTNSYSDSGRLIVEIGPHPNLRGPITQTVKDVVASNTHYLSTLNRKDGDAKSILALMGELICYSANVSLLHVNKIDAQDTQVLTSLPSYNWCHEEKHWNESRRSHHYRLRQFPRHDLLGTMAPDSLSSQPSWHNYIKMSETPWLSGHCIDGTNIFSATGYITMVVEAFRQLSVIENRSWKRKTITMKHIKFITPLLVTSDPIGVEVFLQMRPYSYSESDSTSLWNEFTIFSISRENRSTQHCHGIATVVDAFSQLCHTDSDLVERWVSLDPSRIYKDLRGMGMNYTGAYVCMKSIEACPWRTKVELSVTDTQAFMPSGYQQPHTIHPATLDGCLQAVLPGLKLGDFLTEPAIPSSIDEVHLSTKCNLRPGSSLIVATQSKKHGLAKFTADIWAGKAKTGSKDAIFFARGAKFSSLSSGAGSQLSTQLCYQTKWQIDPFLSSKESILKHCTSDLKNDDQQLGNDLNAFSRSSIKQALNALTLEEAAAVAGYRKHYLEWMRAQGLNDTREITPELENRLKSHGAYGEALARIGPRVKDIIMNKVDGLSLLMQDNLLDRIYLDRNALHRCHAQLANYIRLAKFKIPNIRILEVGGGTGSLTLPVLEALYNDDNSKQCRTTEKYFFSDISTGFLGSLREKLGNFEPFVELKALDIEKPASDQGFELRSFDLILASNVVHATKDLDITLANLKSLLKPGGQLALVELTIPTIQTGMLWGALPGWWLGVDSGRTLGPLLTTSEWDEVLKRNGFSGVDVEMKDYESEEHELSTLLSSVAYSQNTPNNELIQIITREADFSVANELETNIKLHIPSSEVTVTTMFTAQAIKNAVIIILELSQDLLAGASESEWNWIRDTLCNASKILWITQGGARECATPRRALITGLSRNVRTENINLDIYTLDMEPESRTRSEMVSDILQLYTKVLGPQRQSHSKWEWEIAARNGDLLIPRIIPESSASNWVINSVSKYHPRVEKETDPDRSLRLSIRSAGLWDTLYWTDHIINDAKGIPSSHISVRMDFAALNFRDVMSALGQLNGSSSMLIEGAGTVLAVGKEASSRFSVGDAVCFFEPEGLGTVTEINHNQAWIVPKGMRPEIAAAIPLAYGTALYSLTKIANFQPGESILIHSGSGAVGQAAIAVSQYLGAKEIFVTVGSDEKRELIKGQFGIADTHILSSRSLKFGQKILEQTNNVGVDVVLNSLSGEAAVTSCGLLAPFGRFIEIGKRDIENNARMQMQLLRGNKTISVVDLVQVGKVRPEILRQVFQTPLDLIHAGKLQMIHPVTVEHVSRIGEQLESIQTGKHTGKLVMKVDHTQPLKIQPRPPATPTLSPSHSYLVVGGTGGLGKEIVRHLATLGAKRIITLSRSGANGPRVKELMDEMRQSNVELHVVKGDVCDKSTMDAINEITSNSPIKGIIQSAMDLKDALVREMTHEQWSQGTAVKVAGTINLTSSLTATGALDFFVVLGSVVAIAGMQGASNYSASNTFLDAFARHHASKGLPFRAIDLGAVADLGFVADNDDFINTLLVQGAESVTTRQVLAALDYSIANPVASTPDQAQFILGVCRAHPDAGTKESAAQRPDSRFSHIWKDPSQEQIHSNKNLDGQGFDAQTALREAKTPKDAVMAMLMGLKAQVALLMSIQVGEIQSDRSVASYGVDSLIELQLRNWINGHLGASVSMVELMSSMTLAELADTLAQRSRLVHSSVFVA